MATSNSTQLPPRVKDLTGKRFGHQVVIGFAEMRGVTPYWNVRCDCGDERPVSARSLAAGRSTRCRKTCSANPCRKDESGNVYNRLTVIEPVEVRRGDTIWLCRCECGNLTTVSGCNLRKGNTKSCRCLLRSANGRSKTLEHSCWRQIKNRCYNPRYPWYHRYGGRGITICKRWRASFLAFLEDMGKKPFPEASIDRIDNDGNYSCGHCPECLANGWPANCRWATQKEQTRNSRQNHLVTVQGETCCVSEWAERYGISCHTIFTRLCRGWSPERAVTTPPYHGRSG